MMERGPGPRVYFRNCLDGRMHDKDQNQSH